MKTNFKLGLTSSNQRHSFEYSTPIECMCILRSTHTKKARKCQTSHGRRSPRVCSVFTLGCCFLTVCPKRTPERVVIDESQESDPQIEPALPQSCWVTLGLRLSICKMKGQPDNLLNACSPDWWREGLKCTFPHSTLQTWKVGFKTWPFVENFFFFFACFHEPPTECKRVHLK